LEVTSKSYEDSQIASNFHKFWSEEFHCEKMIQDKKKTLIFDCHNLVDLME
jgi:hypothetical protein